MKEIKNLISQRNFQTNTESNYMGVKEMRFLTVILTSVLLLTGCGTALEDSEVKSISSGQGNINTETVSEQINKDGSEKEQVVQPIVEVAAQSQSEGEEKFFNGEFLQLAQHGYINGIDIQVGDLIGEVKQKFGENYTVGVGEGSYFLSYDGFNFHYQANVPYEERENAVDSNEPITAIDVILKDKYFYKDMIEGLGEPDSAFTSELDDSFHMVYNLGSYELWVKTAGGEESPIQYIRLKSVF